jgi:hypothetical protein
MTKEDSVLVLALRALKLLKKGSCWCEIGIGNPMYKNHSEGCKIAQHILEDSK